MAGLPPRPFPLWPGVCVALIVAAALVASESARASPRVQDDPGGGSTIILMQAMSVFAATCLVGEAVALSTWDGSLAALRLRAEDEVLPFDHGEPDAAASERISRADREFSRRLLALLRLCRAPAYLAPTIGLVQSIWPGPAAPTWAEQSWPLLLGLAESGIVLMLSIGIAHAARSIRAGWLALALGRDDSEGGR